MPTRLNFGPPEFRGRPRRQGSDRHEHLFDPPAYAMHESTSPELDALAEMEATALDAATAETQGIMQAVGAAGHRIETLGDSITLGIVCLRRCESC